MHDRQKMESLWIDGLWWLSAACLCCCLNFSW
jgi:hypothetical protein